MQDGGGVDAVSARRAKRVFDRRVAFEDWSLV